MLIYVFRYIEKKIMDEELLRQILSAQDGVEFAPTAEMMMMNSINNE